MCVDCELESKGWGRIPFLEWAEWQVPLDWLDLGMCLEWKWGQA